MTGVNYPDLCAKKEVLSCRACFARIWVYYPGRGGGTRKQMPSFLFVSLLCCLLCLFPALNPFGISQHSLVQVTYQVPLCRRTGVKRDGLGTYTWLVWDGSQLSSHCAAVVTRQRALLVVPAVIGLQGCIANSCCLR